jgi:hypothetical protein
MNTQIFVIVAVLALAIGLVGSIAESMIMTPQHAFADKPRDNPHDRDNGSGNDPGSKAPGQTNNPNPGK